MTRRHDWTHPLCYPCWFRERGCVEPNRIKDALPADCCRCGRSTSAGIFVRVRPGSRQISRCPDAQINRALFGVRS